MMTNPNVKQQPSSSGSLTSDRPWSYSVINAWELCPKKYAAEKVHRSVQPKQGVQQGYGKDVHRAFELRAQAGKTLPLDLKHHEPFIAGVCAIPGEIVTEQRIAVDRDLNPTGFFDSNVWCRGVIDFMNYGSERALIVDWKTGRMQPDFDQLDLMAALTLSLVPSLKKVVGAFYWTKEKKPTIKPYMAGDIPAVWASWLPRVNAFQRGMSEAKFPARQNFLCRAHCDVTGCPHNGRRS